MLVCPGFGMAMVHVSKNLAGDWGSLWSSIRSEGLLSHITSIWPSCTNPRALYLIFGFMAFEAFLTKVVPGKRFEATRTAMGNVPVYQANGMACYIITLFSLLLSKELGVCNPSEVYDLFPEIVSSLNVISLLLCLWMLIQGYYFPSTTDSGTNGSVIVDYYWGVDLYPKLATFDIKMMTNCRFGMMYWAVGILCYAHKNMELNNGIIQNGMAVNVLLQLIYIAKFFHWEMGYMCSMDIQHDRAGFYLCWGCLVWIPSVYTSHSFYLAENCPDMSDGLCLLTLVLGFVAIFINYDSDNQRYVFRQSGGNCHLWGSSTKPDWIVATYKAGSETRTNLLLTSGWWSLSRHFHYVPELTAAFLWSSPARATSIVSGYFYFCFLLGLLTDRAFRDDDRCRNKYGKDWEKYCDLVPNKILPKLW